MSDGMNGGKVDDSVVVSNSYRLTPSPAPLSIAI